MRCRCCVLHRGEGATAADNISGYSAAAREAEIASEVGTPCHFSSRKMEGCLDVHPREYDLVYKPYKIHYKWGYSIYKWGIILY